MACISRDCCRACVVIISRTGTQVVTAGIGLFILLPILRVILMLTIFVKERDYKFAATAAVVLLIIFAGFAIGILSK